jgi:hypothetical protein
MRTGNLPAALRFANKLVFALPLKPAITRFTAFYHTFYQYSGERLL